MTVFRALSIVRPGGQAIARREKTVEVRRWRPPTVPLTDLLIIENTVYLSVDGAEDPDGRVVALVDVVAVTPWTPDLFAAACATRFAEGYLAWHLTNIRAVSAARPVRAARGIYELDLDAAAMIVVP